MILEKAVFARFLDLIRLKGEVENKECLLNISKGGIESFTISNNNVVATHARLIGSFEDMGLVGIDSLPLLRSLLSSLDISIEIKKESNKLLLSSGKTKVKAVLRNFDYIRNKLSTEDYEKVLKKTGTNFFELKVEDIKKLNTSMSSLGSGELIMKAKGGTLEVYFGNNENEIINSFEIESKIEFKTKLSKFFIDTLSMINDKVEIAIETGKPVLINYTNETLSFNYIIAPLQLD